MVYVATTKYNLDVQIVDHVDNEGEPCTHCQLVDATVQVQAYLPVGEVGELEAETWAESCTGCMFRVIDSTPYLDTDRTIVVEVSRSATNRPF